MLDGGATISSPPVRTTRRKYLKYLAAAAVVAGAAALGAYEYPDYFGKETTTAPTTQAGATTSTLAPVSTSTLNPVVGYALENGIDPEVANELSVLQELDKNNKTLVDYLSHVNGLVPAGDNQKESARSLQLKVLYGHNNISGILSDGRVTNQETLALRYLSGLDAETQKAYVLFGLDEHVSEYLAIISAFPDQDFARLAVKNSLCMRAHHKLTDTEATYLARLDESYSSYPEAVEELTRLPDLLDVDERDLAAVDEILFLVEQSKHKAPYQKAFTSMLDEGIKRKRRYCSPLQALLWAAYDHDFHRSNPLQGYSLQALINRCWRQDADYVSKSGKWSNFDVVCDRLNSPDLVSIFTRDHFRYNYYKPPTSYLPASMIFLKNRDDPFVCVDFSIFQSYPLRFNGYNAWVVGMGVETVTGHNVCGYNGYDERWRVLDNEGVKKGPFGSLDALCDSYSGLKGASIILINPMDITYPGNAFLYPHIVYRKSS